MGLSKLTLSNKEFLGDKLTSELNGIVKYIGKGHGV